MKLITVTEVADFKGHYYTQTLSRAHIRQGRCAVSSVAASEMFDAVGKSKRQLKQKP